MPTEHAHTLAHTLKRRLKKTARRAVTSLPMKRRVMQAAALAPTVLKGAYLERTFRPLLGLPEFAGHTFLTNLAVPGHRLRLDASAGSIALFGSPRAYLGEHGALELMRALISDCRAFVDVGAHRGYFTLLAHATTRGKLPIHFFEPNPKLFEALAAAVEANGLERIHGHDAALGAAAGRQRFYVLPESDYASSLVQPDAALPSAPIDVQVDTFDDFVRREGLDDLFVKVDVENAEPHFLDGAASEAGRIRYLVIELLAPAIAQGLVNQIRERHGFHAYYINDLRLEHSPDGSFQNALHQYNWLFCRLAPTALRKRLARSRFEVVESIA